MALMSKSDLKKKYSWTTDGGDDPDFRSGSDKALLDRTEGYEVLYFINKLADDLGFKKKALGEKLERMIHATPGNLGSHENIKKWISDNWNTFSG